jgi:hypothetical protein
LGGRSTDVIDEDVHTLEAAQNLTDHLRRALRSREIGLDEMTVCFSRGGGSGRHDDCCTSLEKAIGYGFASAFCAAGYQDTLAAEFIRVGSEFVCAVILLYRCVATVS